MGIGGGIVLAAIGAILFWGISVDSVDVVNIDVIGIILMVAGAVIAVVAGFASQRSTETTTTVTRSDGTVEERRQQVQRDDPSQR